MFTYLVKIVNLIRNMKHKIDNYLKTRSLCVFIVFIFINILANLPYINLYADIFSHFKLQYIIN